MTDESRCRREEKRDGWNLMPVLAKAVECGEWERDVREMEASTGRSGRLARTSRIR